MLLDRLRAIARRLHFTRWLLWPCLGVCALAFSAAVLQPAFANWTQPAFIGTVWSILALSFILGFQQVPAQSDAGWWRRTLRSIHRGAYLLLALLTAAATLGLVLLTARLLLYAS